MTNNDELKGLGGWLILVGIGVVIAPIRLAFFLVQSYKPIFENGAWTALTTAGSEFYIPYFGTLLISELVFNCFMLVASVWLIYLFARKHYLFPRVYIVISLASVVFIPLDAWVVTKIIPGEPMFDPVTAREFARAAIGAVIWVPYMLVSERVKQTFVEGIPEPKNADLSVEVG